MSLQTLVRSWSPPWPEGQIETRPETVAHLTRWALIVILGSFFYAAGNFGFLNVFGVRREVQAALCLGLLLFFPVLASKPTRWLVQPLWWLTFVYVLSDVFIRHDVSSFFLVHRLGAMYLVALLFALSYQFSEQVLRAVITLSAIFSTMVIVQALAVWFNPDVLSSFVLGYSSGSADARVSLGHPLEYLGLVSPGTWDVFGHPFARLRSFASEPSALTCTFLAPGLLALTFNGPIRLAAIPILVFAVVLSGSGVLYLSVALGVAAWPVLFILRRHPGLLGALPILFVPFWYWWLLGVDLAEMLTVLAQWLQPLEAYSLMVNKVVSGQARLGPVMEQIRDIRVYRLFGAPVPGGGGFLLHTLLRSGVVGLLLACAVSYRITRGCAVAFGRCRGRQRLAAALLYGAYFQVLFFAELGWSTTSGFVLLVLITRRLNVMSRVSVADAERRHQSLVPGGQPAPAEA